MDEAISWIRNNMIPGEVFSDYDLYTWARDTKRVEDVFSSDELGRWAIGAGFVVGDENE